MTTKPAKDLDLDLLGELEGQKQSNIERMRAHERTNIRTKIVLRPGNASELRVGPVAGLTCDLSVGGCRAVFPHSIMVGDVYRLSIELEQQELPTVYARAMRCRFVKENMFEVGFAFFSQLDLGSFQSSSAGSDSLNLL